MTVSSEPDGSILSVARRDLSSGSAAMFVFFCFLGFFLHGCFENRLSLSCTMSGMLSMSIFPFLCCKWNIDSFNITKQPRIPGQTWNPLPISKFLCSLIALHQILSSWEHFARYNDSSNWYAHKMHKCQGGKKALCKTVWSKFKLNWRP